MNNNALNGVYAELELPLGDGQGPAVVGPDRIVIKKK